MVRLRGSEPALAHSDVVAAVPDRILGQDPREFVERDPARSIVLGVEDGGGVAGSVTMKDPDCPLVRHARRLPVLGDGSKRS